MNICGRVTTCMHNMHNLLPQFNLLLPGSLLTDCHRVLHMQFSYGTNVMLNRIFILLNLVSVQNLFISLSNDVPLVRIMHLWFDQYT